MHPILILTMGQVRQRNGVKPPKTRVLDVKYVVRNQMDVVCNRTNQFTRVQVCWGLKTQSSQHTCARINPVVQKSRMISNQLSANQDRVDKESHIHMLHTFHKYILYIRVWKWILLQHLCKSKIQRKKIFLTYTHYYVNTVPAQWSWSNKSIETSNRSSHAHGSNLHPQLDEAQAIHLQQWE